MKKKSVGGQAMKSMYLEKTILFLTDVPYVIKGRGADIFDNGTHNVFVNNFNIVYIEK